MFIKSTITSLILFFAVKFLFAHQGAMGNEIVYPVSVNPFTIPQSTEPNLFGQEVERHLVPDHDLIERNSKKLLSYDPSVQRVSVAGSDALPIFIWNSWNGPNQNGWVPADPDVAEGGSTFDGWTIIVTNEQIHIYSNATHSVLITATFQSWFSPVGSVTNIFDPKVIFDVWNSRWVFIALGRSGTQSYYYLSVSQTSDPTGNWWIYRLNAHVDGSTTTTNWADYPGLGFSYPSGGSGFVGCIAITSNQWTQTNIFQYAKVRLLKTSQLYVGAGVTWYDFWNYHDQNNDPTFTPKPARQLSGTPSGGQIFMLNTKYYGSNVVTLWRIDNPAAVTPTMTRQATVGVTSYTPPPDAPEPGGTIDAFDCSTQNLWFMNNHVYTAWVSATDWGSGNNAIVHYARINTTTNALINESRFGNNGIWFIFPSACPEFKSPYSNGNAGVQFAISNSSTFPSHCVIGYEPITGLSSYSTVSGTGSLPGPYPARYGDYGGITPSATQDGVFWSAGMIANSGSWGTGAFRFAFTAPPIGIHNQNGDVPSAFQLDQNYPNPFNPVTKISYALPVSGNVKLSVYDMLGSEVAVITNEHQKAGFYETTFDASSLSSGVYFYRLSSGDFTANKKMTLIK